MKKENKWAFSLVEMMVALIAIACIAASVTPIVTKKITGRKLNLSTNLVNLTIDCEEKFGPECKLCEKTKRCLVCNKLCSAGTYTETETCKCIACTTIDTNCKLCQRGAQCTQCQPGYYLENNTCKICPKGYKCSSGVTKDICNVGEYQDKEGQTSCLKCAAGTYNPNKGLTTVCAACPAGKYNLTQGNSSCSTCEAGYYCPGGSGHGDCWTKNAHYSHAGASSCSACWAGTYATDASGNWSGNYRGTTCLTCPAGWKCNGTPVACGAGTCQNNTGQSSCKNCSSVVANCSNCNATTCGCSSCNSGYTLSGGKCCGNVSNCASYNTSCGCSSCNSGYTLSGGKCCGNVSNCASYNTSCGCSSCNSGYSLTGGICCAEKASCSTYNTSCACTKCSKGYYVSGGNCVKCEAGYKCTDGVNRQACADGYYSAAGNSGNCTRCSGLPRKCAICNKTTGKCGECESGYTLKSDGYCWGPPTNIDDCKGAYYSSALGACVNKNNQKTGISGVSYLTAGSGNCTKDTNSKRCCWKGYTATDGDNRLVCTQKAAVYICSKIDLLGASWALITKADWEDGLFNAPREANFCGYGGGFWPLCSNSSTNSSMRKCKVDGKNTHCAPHRMAFGNENTKENINVEDRGEYTINESTKFKYEAFSVRCITRVVPLK